MNSTIININFTETIAIWSEKDGREKGKPNSTDMLFLLAALGISQEKNQSRISFCPLPFLKMCGKGNDGFWFRRLRKSFLEVWPGVELVFDGNFYENGGDVSRKVSRKFRIVDRAEMVDGELAVEFNAEFLAANRVSYVRGIPLSYYQVVSPMASRLAEILCTKFHVRETWEIGVQKLVQKMGLSIASTAKALYRLKPLIEEVNANLFPVAYKVEGKSSDRKFVFKADTSREGHASREEQRCSRTESGKPAEKPAQAEPEVSSPPIPKKQQQDQGKDCPTEVGVVGEKHQAKEPAAIGSFLPQIMSAIQTADQPNPQSTTLSAVSWEELLAHLPPTVRPEEVQSILATAVKERGWDYALEKVVYTTEKHKAGKVEKYGAYLAKAIRENYGRGELEQQRAAREKQLRKEEAKKAELARKEEKRQKDIRDEEKKKRRIALFEEFEKKKGTPEYDEIMQKADQAALEKAQECKDFPEPLFQAHRRMLRRFFLIDILSAPGAVQEKF